MAWTLLKHLFWINAPSDSEPSSSSPSKTPSEWEEVSLLLLPRLLLKGRSLWVSGRTSRFRLSGDGTLFLSLTLSVPMAELPTLGQKDLTLLRKILASGTT